MFKLMLLYKGTHIDLQMFRCIYIYMYRCLHVQMFFSCKTINANIMLMLMIRGSSGIFYIYQEGECGGQHDSKDGEVYRQLRGHSDRAYSTTTGREEKNRSFIVQNAATVSYYERALQTKLHHLCIRKVIGRSTGARFITLVQYSGIPLVSLSWLDEISVMGTLIK